MVFVRVEIQLIYDGNDNIFNMCCLSCEEDVSVDADDTHKFIQEWVEFGAKHIKCGKQHV